MNRCLICFNSVEEKISNNKVCNKCINKFNFINKHIYVDGVETTILYLYDDFFKELLYRYKGCYDLSLKDAFFNNNLKCLQAKYKKFKIVCAPSYILQDKQRGFNHIKELAKVLNLEIIDCLYKSKDYKQSDVKIKNRSQIKKVIKIKKYEFNKKDKILILDDVTTSLSTLKTIIKLLPKDIEKKALILASSCRFINEKE